MATSINKTSISSAEFNPAEQARSPKAASFGGVERIRSSSFDGFHSKHFIDATYKYAEWNVCYNLHVFSIPFMQNYLYIADLVLFKSIIFVLLLY